MNPFKESKLERHLKIFATTSAFLSQIEQKRFKEAEKDDQSIIDDIEPQNREYNTLFPSINVGTKMNGGLFHIYFLIESQLICE